MDNIRRLSGVLTISWDLLNWMPSKKADLGTETGGIGKESGLYPHIQEEATCLIMFAVIIAFSSGSPIVQGLQVEWICAGIVFQVSLLLRYSSTQTWWRHCKPSCRALLWSSRHLAGKARVANWWTIDVMDIHAHWLSIRFVWIDLILYILQVETEDQLQIWVASRISIGGIAFRNLQCALRTMLTSFCLNWVWFCILGSCLFLIDLFTVTNHFTDWLRLQGSIACGPSRVARGITSRISTPSTGLWKMALWRNGFLAYNVKGMQY